MIHQDAQKYLLWFDLEAENYIQSYFATDYSP